MFRVRLKQLRMLFFLSIFKMISRFKKADHWIIAERGSEARDNGYSFYKYMKEKHPEQKIYYLITKDSSDYEKVKNDAVIFNSVRSYYLIMSAKKIVSAHYASILPLPVGTKIFYLFKLYNKFYFLQHGVTKDDLKSLYANVAPMRLFVCGAKPEYEDIKKRYGHPAGVVRYTGFARFDYLHNLDSKNQILIMPTWRTYIKTDTEFINSEFYIKWQQLLIDPSFVKLMEQNKIKLIFYVHYEMQKYTKYFKVTSPNVLIATVQEYDVQILLRESRLLITDYSSVFFDFAYMEKPTVFYQFDQYHYVKGYFDYRRDGFGEVCNEHIDVIRAVGECIDNDFVMGEFYTTRVKNFFPLHDDKNCARIYNAIIEC